MDKELVVSFFPLGGCETCKHFKRAKGTCKFLAVGGYVPAELQWGLTCTEWKYWGRSN